MTPSPHKIQGIGAGFVPKNLDLSLVDRVEQVSNEEAIATARAPGARGGHSRPESRAARRWWRPCVWRANPAQAGKTIVVVLPDAGERYLSGALFEGLFEEVEKMQAVA